MWRFRNINTICSIEFHVSFSIFCCHRGCRLLLLLIVVGLPWDGCETRLRTTAASNAETWKQRQATGTDSGPPTCNTAKPQHLLRHRGLAAVQATQKYSYVAVIKPACLLTTSPLPANYLAVAISV